MSDHVIITNRVDAAIKRNGTDIVNLRADIDRLIDQFGERLIVAALIECAAIAYGRNVRGAAS